MRLREREPDAHRARPHAPRRRHRALAHSHRDRVTRTPRIERDTNLRKVYTILTLDSPVPTLSDNL